MGCGILVIGIAIIIVVVMIAARSGPKRTALRVLKRQRTLSSDLLALQERYRGSLTPEERLSLNEFRQKVERAAGVSIFSESQAEIEAILDDLLKSTSSALANVRRLSLTDDERNWVYDFVQYERYLLVVDLHHLASPAWMPSDMKRSVCKRCNGEAEFICTTQEYSSGYYWLYHWQWCPVCLSVHVKGSNEIGVRGI